MNVCKSLACLIVLQISATLRADDLVLVDKGISKVPIVLAVDASAETLRAANDLAEYISKISDARPEVLRAAIPGRPRIPREGLRF